MRRPQPGTRQGDGVLLNRDVFRLQGPDGGLAGWLNLFRDAGLFQVPEGQEVEVFKDVALEVGSGRQALARPVGIPPGRRAGIAEGCKLVPSVEAGQQGLAGSPAIFRQDIAFAAGSDHANPVSVGPGQAADGVQAFGVDSDRAVVHHPVHDSQKEPGTGIAVRILQEGAQAFARVCGQVLSGLLQQGRVDTQAQPARVLQGAAEP